MRSKVVNPVAPGDPIQFMLTLELILSQGGGTSELPLTVTFGVKNTGGPEVPVVKFGKDQLTDTATWTYAKLDSKVTPLTTYVTATAPTTPGSYHFKIQAIEGFNGKGLQPGEGIVIHFKVEDPAPTCEPAVTDLTVADPACLLFHEPTTSFTATLASGGAPLAGKTVKFSVDGVAADSGVTGLDGKATVSFASNALSVGDHTVVATYDGEECLYKPDSASATFGVTYKFNGFQPPVQISGVGAGLFSGKVIPVKIKIADYYNLPVSGVEPRVYFTQTQQDIWTQALAIQPEIADSGNLMRYDPVSDQYILNWDISGIVNGSYNIRVAMDEGEKCTVGHWCPVKIQRSGKK